MDNNKNTIFCLLFFCSFVNASADWAKKIFQYISSDKKHTIGSAVILAGLLYYKYGLFKMPEVHEVDENILAGLKRMFSESHKDDIENKEITTQKSLLLQQLLNELCRKNSSYSKNIILKNTSNIASIFGKENKREHFYDFLQKQCPALIPFIALESIEPVEKKYYQKYFLPHDQRSFYAFGKNGKAYYYLDIEHQKFNFLARLYKVSFKGFLEKSGNSFLEFSYDVKKNEKNKVEFYIEKQGKKGQSIVDTKLDNASNNIEVVKNILHRAKFFQQHVKTYISNVLSHFKNSKDVNRSDSVENKLTPEYEVDDEEYQKLEELFKRLDKENWSERERADLDLRKKLTIKMLNHLCNIKSMYAEKIVNKNMLELNKFLDSKYTLQSKIESPFIKKLKEKNAESLLPVIALQSIEKYKDLYNAPQLVFSNVKDLLFEIKQKDASNTVRYFLIFFGDSVTQKINIKLCRKVSDKIDVASSSFLSLSYYQDKNKKDQEPIIFYQTENQNEVLISTQNMYKYSITSAKNLAQLVCVKDFFESEIKDILKKISPEEKIKNEQ